MPRRNHKARCLPDADTLAAGLGILALPLALADAKYPCAGCHRRGYWGGDHCPACTGRIILSARHHLIGKAVNP